MGEEIEKEAVATLNQQQDGSVGMGVHLPTGVWRQMQVGPLWGARPVTTLDSRWGQVCSFLLKWPLG